MRYIGDIHGKANLYYNAIKDVDESIQIGDFGFGFTKELDDILKFEFSEAKGNHRFIRGNHDNPAVCKEQPQFIGSGIDQEHHKSFRFFVNGGWSIDGPGCPWCPSYNNVSYLPRRTRGLDWWEDEEHSIDELNQLYDDYCDAKPAIVVSHEGPVVATDYFFSPTPKWVSRTASTLQRMFEFHQPDLWIFGHWHKRKDDVLDSTRFICLQEGGYIDI